MKKRLFSYCLFLLSLSMYGQGLKPYEEIGKTIQATQASIKNPTYNIPCGTVSREVYFQSAIYVGDAVTKPLAYFAQEPPVNYYVSSSKNITTVQKGKSFELRLTAHLSEAKKEAYAIAYTDWNRDGEFEANLGEQRIAEDATLQTTSISYKIDIPESAQIGKNRIRVFLADYPLASLSPTSPVNPGIIYDFIFYVTEAVDQVGFLVTVSSNNMKAGNAIINTPSPTNDGRYSQNSNVTIKAIKKDETAVFAGWIDGLKIVSTDMEYSFSVNNNPMHLIAVFESPVPVLEAPQISTAESPIWYQIKNAQTDSRLNSYIAFEENPSGSYTTKIHLEKPAKITDKFLWRLESSSENHVKLINKNGNIQLYTSGGFGALITPSNDGSDFLVKPSGHSNGSYSILYEGIFNKLLNGDPQWKLLLYHAGVGTGSGWYFYRVPIASGSPLLKNTNIKIYRYQNQIVILGTHSNEIIKIYNLLGENTLSCLASDAETRISLYEKGIFIITIQNPKEFIHTQKIII